MRFRVYGRYCGPGWSGGKYRKDDSYKVNPIDAWDAACARHDALIGGGNSLYEADKEFLKDSLSVMNPMGPFPFVYHGLSGAYKHGVGGGDRTPSPKKKGKLPETPVSMSKTDRKGKGKKTVKRKRSSTSAAGTSSKKRKMSVKKQSTAQRRSHYSAGTIRSSKKMTSRRVKYVRKPVSHVNYEYENGKQLVETRTSGNNVSQTLFVGHSTANFQKQQQVFWATAVKLLLVKAGYDVPSFDTSIKDVFVHVVYQLGSSATQSTYDTTTTTRTLDGFTLDLYNQFQVATTTVLTFKYITLRTTINATGEASHELASLNMERLLVKYQVRSILKMQNTTRSGSENTSTTQVSINPVKLKKYQLSEAHFNVSGPGSNSDNALLTSNGLGYAAGTGLIDFFCEASALAGTATQEYLRSAPDPKLVVGCKRTSTSYLQPGAMIKDYVTYTKIMYFNTIFKQLDVSTAGSQGNVVQYGRSNVFCWDKIIDNRAEKEAPEAFVEIVQHFSASCYMKAPTMTASKKAITIPTYA